MKGGGVVLSAALLLLLLLQLVASTVPEAEKVEEEAEQVDDGETALVEVGAGRKWSIDLKSMVKNFNAPHLSPPWWWRLCQMTGDPHPGNFHNQWGDYQITGEVVLWESYIDDTRIHNYEVLRFNRAPAYNQGVAMECRGSVFAYKNDDRYAGKMTINGETINDWQGRSLRFGPFSVRSIRRHNWFTQVYVMCDDRAALDFNIYSWGASFGYLDIRLSVHQRYDRRSNGLCAIPGDRSRCYRNKNQQCTSINDAGNSFTVRDRSKSLFAERLPYVPPPKPYHCGVVTEANRKRCLIESSMGARLDSKLYKACMEDACVNPKWAATATVEARLAELRKKMEQDAERKKIPAAIPRTALPPLKVLHNKLCVSWGDPHLVSFGGRLYADLHATGEIIMFMTGITGDRVHVIHEYGANRRAPAYITAVGVKSGNDVVTFRYMDPRVSKGRARGGILQLRYNNQVVPLNGQRTRRFGRNFRVSRSSHSGIDIDTNEDVNVKVNTGFHGGTYYMSVYIRVDKKYAKDTRGCCGNYDGQWISRQRQAGPLWKVGQTWRSLPEETLFPKFRQPPAVVLTQKPAPFVPKPAVPAARLFCLKNVSNKLKGGALKACIEDKIILNTVGPIKVVKALEKIARKKPAKVPKLKLRKVLKKARKILKAKKPTKKPNRCQRGNRSIIVVAPQSGDVCPPPPTRRLTDIEDEEAEERLERLSDVMQDGLERDLKL